VEWQAGASPESKNISSGGLGTSCDEKIPFLFLFMGFGKYLIESKFKLILFT